MPQLDKLSFINQLFWFFFFYICFYYLMLKTFLPVIGRTIKLREKLLKTLVSNNSFLNKNVAEVTQRSIAIINVLQSLIKSIAIDKQGQDSAFQTLKDDETFVDVKKVFVEESLNITRQKLLIK